MSRFIKYWLPVLAWAGLIFYFSSLPNLHTEFGGLWDLVLRKGAHGAEYGMLAILLSRLVAPRPNNYRLRYLVVFLLAAGYAASDEWHQSFVLGRTATVYDVMIDVVGVLVGMLLHGWAVLRLKPTK